MNENYILIGDSITYGIGDNNNLGWANLFKKDTFNFNETSSYYRNVHILGIPGATTNDIKERINSIIYALSVNIYKNIIVLAIGVNDTQLYSGDFNYVFDNFKENIIYIIKTIKEKDCDVIVLGITRITLNENPEKNNYFYYNKTNILEYEKDLKIIETNDNNLKNICDENNIKYISLTDVLNKNDYIDGLHPNEVGHKKIFNKLKEEITTM